MNETLQEYEALTRKTQELWAANPGAGAHVGLPKGYLKHSLSVGSYFEAGPLLNEFLDELETHGGLTLVPRASLHFTFLGLIGNDYERREELPADAPEIAALIDRVLGGLDWRMTDLRLVPGSNFLLLAGLPNAEALAARRALVDALLVSRWGANLRTRYLDRGYALPPKVWHTTLCRHASERFPIAVRELYAKWSARDFGAIELGYPRFRAPNYDWSAAWPIEP